MDYTEMRKKMLYTKIEEMVEEIQKMYEIPVPIKDIDTVVQGLGGCVLEVGKAEDEGVFKTGEDSFEIRISSLQEPYRRFLIAQCVGHVFLHMGYQTNDELWGRYSLTKKFMGADVKQAYEAEHFAFCLLMPRVAFEKAIDESTKQHATGCVVDTGTVAKKFGVSIGMAKLWGERLRFLRPW